MSITRQWTKHFQWDRPDESDPKSVLQHALRLVSRTVYAGGGFNNRRLSVQFSDGNKENALSSDVVYLDPALATPGRDFDDRADILCGNALTGAHIKRVSNPKDYADCMKQERDQWAAQITFASEVARTDKLIESESPGFAGLLDARSRASANPEAIGALAEAVDSPQTSADIASALLAHRLVNRDQNPVDAGVYEGALQVAEKLLSQATSTFETRHTAVQIRKQFKKLFDVPPPPPPPPQNSDDQDEQDEQEQEPKQGQDQDQSNDNDQQSSSGQQSGTESGESDDSPQDREPDGDEESADEKNDEKNDSGDSEKDSGDSEKDDSSGSDDQSDGENDSSNEKSDGDSGKDEAQENSDEPAEDGDGEDSSDNPGEPSDSEPGEDSSDDGQDQEEEGANDGQEPDSEGQDQEGEGEQSEADGTGKDAGDADAGAGKPSDSGAPYEMTPEQIEAANAMSEALQQMMGLVHGEVDNASELPESTVKAMPALPVGMDEPAGGWGPAVKAAGTRLQKAASGDRIEYERLARRVRSQAMAIRRKFLFRSDSEVLHEYGLRSGELDEGGLHRLTYENDNPAVFSQKTVRGRSPIVVTILVDESGSMVGGEMVCPSCNKRLVRGGFCPDCPKTGGVMRPKFEDAREVAVMLYEALSQVPGMELSMYGHTEMSDTCIVIEYLVAGRSRAESKYALTGIRARHGNTDSVAVNYCVNQMVLSHPGNVRKLLFVVSDGQPAEDLSLLPRAVKEARKRGVEVYGIGIQNAFPQTRADELYGEGHAVVLPDTLSAAGIIGNFLIRLAKRTRR